MLEIVLALVFSIVMLVFMAFPAMKIVQGIETFIPMSQKKYDIVVVLTTIFLSLLVGLFLKYW